MPVRTAAQCAAPDASQSARINALDVCSDPELDNHTSTSGPGSSGGESSDSDKSDAKRGVCPMYAMLRSVYRRVYDLVYEPCIRVRCDRPAGQFLHHAEIVGCALVCECQFSPNVNHELHIEFNTRCISHGHADSGV